MNFFQLFQKKSFKAPYERQVKLCEQLGLVIGPRMDVQAVSKLIETALKKEKYRVIYKRIQFEREERAAEFAAETEKEERGEYGDHLYDEREKWEQYCDASKQYELVFIKRGKVVADVVEFEDVEIVGKKKFRIKIGILLPKIHNDEPSEGDYGKRLEWEKEVYLEPSQILLIRELLSTIDIDDLERYRGLKEQLEAFNVEGLVNLINK